jgi:hypothetical protein
MPLNKQPLLLLLILFFAFGCQCEKKKEGLFRGWWMWTPGDHVDDSTQSNLVSGYHPDQPIPFSHKLHAGDRKMDCEYCHSNARRSPAAGVPPLNTCIACHQIVNTDAEPIKKLNEHFKKNEPFPWTLVHKLPEYVRFSHKVHVLAKDNQGQPRLNCQTCHGPVEKMTTVEQWAPLQMGWCIDCHSQVKEPATPFKKATTLAPVTCNTCHY